MTKSIKVGQNKNHTYYRSVPTDPILTGYKTNAHKILADLIWWAIDQLIRMDQRFNGYTIQEETKKVETLVFNVTYEKGETK